MLVSWTGRMIILVVSVLTVAAIYTVFYVVIPRRRRPKTIEEVIPRLDSIGVFDERVFSTNNRVVTYKASRLFAANFAQLKSDEDFEKAKVTLFDAIEGKLKETLSANPGADLSKYESAFCITIISVLPSQAS